MARFAVLAPLFALLLLGTPVTGLQIDDSKNRPVTKVINLLKDMLKQLEKESEEDEDIYEKMGCWCVTYEKEKNKAIKDGGNRITELEASISDQGALYAQLTTEVENLNKEIEKNTAALDSATELRKKQLAEFNEEEKAALTSITSLKGAIITLTKQNPAASALLQGVAEKDRLRLATALQDVLRKHRALFQESITPKQRKMLQTFVSFVEKPNDYFDDSTKLLQAKAGAPSSEIFGILKQMKEDFESNLAKSQREEVTNQQAYDDLKAAKQAEIAAGTAQADDKSAAAAAAAEKKASDSIDLEDTKSTLAEDTKFLADLKSRCATMDQDFVARTSTRQQEIGAVSKALEFLSSDEAHDLFTRTFNPALVQRRAQSVSARREALARLLKEAAKRSSDPRLSALSVSARLDAFEEVKKTIQGMIDKLLKEKDDDVKHKDYCVDEFHKNSVETEDHYTQRDMLVSKIEDLGMTIDNLSRTIENLQAEVQEMQVNMKRATEQREKANQEYQSVVADQRATAKLLTAALNVLKGFYEKAALVQGGTQAKAAAASASKQAPPPGFRNYENNAAAGGVLGMIQGIIDDSKAMEAEAIRSEEEAVADYEEFVKDTTEGIETNTKDIVHKSEEKAKTEKAKVQAEVARDTTLSEIEELEQVEADLHKSCDFLMKNFDTRVEARDAEMEALKQGLALFSGASFGAFLQHLH